MRQLPADPLNADRAGGADGADRPRGPQRQRWAGPPATNVHRPPPTRHRGGVVGGYCAGACECGWKSHNGAQPGDPAKLAQALIAIIGQDEPPLRFVAGADAIEATEGKANELLAQARASRDLGANLAYDDANV
jgi:hypothetical protein